MGIGKEEINKIKDDIINFADIGEFINYPIKTYSSGMYARLAFAVAIHVNPDILIVDEALSVGDVFLQQKCYKRIKELAGKATVLIVSHDLNAMTKFCKRILVMDKGNLVFDGEPNEAITKYFKIKQGHIKTSQKIELSINEDYKINNYRVPNTGKYSGNMDVVIEKYFYSINNKEYSEYCHKDDEIRISMIVNSKKNIENLIVGYQVRDKYGNEVFGETSLTSPVEQFKLNEGRNMISFKFMWPEVREGDYFITLGIGEGMEILNQVEQCWINNEIHVVASVMGKIIFGVFNNAMDEFVVKSI